MNLPLRRNTGTNRNHPQAPAAARTSPQIGGFRIKEKYADFEISTPPIPQAIK
jgi:hypothetical protein